MPFGVAASLQWVRSRTISTRHRGICSASQVGVVVVEWSVDRVKRVSYQLIAFPHFFSLVSSHVDRGEGRLWRTHRGRDRQELSLLEGIDSECCDNPHGTSHAAGSNQTTTDIPSRMSLLGGAGRSNRRFLIDAAEQRTKS